MEYFDDSDTDEEIETKASPTPKDNVQDNSPLLETRDKYLRKRK